MKIILNEVRWEKWGVSIDDATIWRIFREAKKCTNQVDSYINQVFGKFPNFKNWANQRRFHDADFTAFIGKTACVPKDVVGTIYRGIGTVNR